MAADVKVDIDLETRSARRALEGFRGDFNKFSKDGVQSISKMDIAIGNLAANIATGLGRGALNLASAALRGFTNQIQQGISAAQVQEDAINELNTQLRISGEFTRETSRDLQEYASNLQTTSKFGDEAVLSQLAFAQAMGASAEQSKQVVGAGADLAASLNIDLNSAVRNVAKTLGGYAGELGEVIPELKNLTQEQLRAGEGVDLLAQKFSGAAAAQIETFSGATQQLSNTFGDFQEELGFIVTQSPVTIAAVKSLEEGFSFLGKEVSDNQEGLKDLSENIITGTLVSGVMIATETIISLNSALTTTKNFVNFLADTFLAANQSTAEFTLSFAQLQKSIAEFTGASTAAFDETIARTKTQIETIKQARLAGDQETAARIEANDKLKDSLRETQEVVKQSLKEQIQAQKDAQEKEDPENSPRVQNEKKVAQAVIDQRKKLFSELQLIELEQKQLEQESDIIENETQMEKRERELERLLEFESKKSEIKLAQKLEENKNITNAEQKELANQKAFAEAQNSVLKAQLDFEKNIEKERVQNKLNTLRTLGTITSNFSSVLRQGSAEQKALASANAIINTYAGATAALAPPPLGAGPIFGPILAGSIIAKGLAQVSKINSQSFQSGGVVGGFQGATGGADTTIANVRTGEMVLNASQQRNLFDNINQGGGDNSEMISAINRLANRPVSVQIEGKEVARSVRDAREEGFAI